MKKIFLGIAIASTLLSCKEETKEKVKEASEAVGTDLKQAADSAKVKAKKAKPAKCNGRAELVCAAEGMA